MRADHEICKLLFSPEPACKEVFEKREDYDAHLLSEDHVIPQKRSSLDVARSKFVMNMKAFSTHRTRSLGTVAYETSLQDAISNHPLMNSISQQGWALPQRHTFRYTYEQKKVLYDIFVDGLKTGNKMSPEQAKKVVRKTLKVNLWVECSQIRSLFSSFSKKNKQNSLLPPKPPMQPNNVQTTVVDTDEEVVVDEEEGKEVESEDLNIDIQRELLHVMSDLADWEVNDYVAVVYNDNWYPGVVTSINDDKTITVNCLEYADRFKSSNKFSWPKHKDEKPYDIDDVILKLDPPNEISSKRHKYFYFCDGDYTGACDVFKMVLDSK